MSQKFTFKLKENYNSIIPLKIYQTWYTKNLPKHMNDNVKLLKTQIMSLNIFYLMMIVEISLRRILMKRCYKHLIN